MQARLRNRIWIMMGLTNRIPAAVTMGSRPWVSMQQAAKSKRQGMNRSQRLPSLRVAVNSSNSRNSRNTTTRSSSVKG